MIEWWGQHFLRPKTCYNLIRISILKKICNLGVYGPKDIGNSFRNSFCRGYLDAMMKRAAVRFLCILGIQYMIGSVFSFSVILKPKSLEYCVNYY